MRIRNPLPKQPVFLNFEVRSDSGMTYQVEVCDLNERAFSWTCADFRQNGLGTCKQGEAVLIHAQRKAGKAGWRQVLD